jgi:hypothetical protein
MRCPSCPIGDAACLGEPIPRLCVIAASRGGDPVRILAQPNGVELPPPVRPVDLGEILARIGACPDRGETLSHHEQPGCGCSEFNACGRGRGDEPGRVILRDCIVCSLTTIYSETGSLTNEP